MSKGKAKSRSELRPLINAFKAALEHYTAKIEICGSWRRGKQHMADVDVVILPNDHAALLRRIDLLQVKDIFCQGLRADDRTHWGDLNRTINYQDVTFDLKIANEDNYGYKVWLATGPAQPNAALMALLKSSEARIRFHEGHGWHVTYDANHPAFDTRRGYAKIHKLHLPHEDTFFAALGFPETPTPSERIDILYRRYLAHGVLGVNFRHYYAVADEPPPQAEAPSQLSLF